MSTVYPPLSEARIAAYLRGELDESQRLALEAAMDAEPRWLEVLAMLAEEVSTGHSEPEDSTVGRIDRAYRTRLRPGQKVARFEIEHPLGRGGMGSIHAAYDPSLRRSVALKVLHAANETAQPRLLSEARTLAQVNHPNVVTVLDVGTWEGRVYLAMELIDGETLREWRSASSPSWRDIVDLYLQAARGLSAAHTAGVVHRDVKPANVMVSRTGRVIVLDFGLAIEHEGGESGAFEGTGRTRGAGTPAYASFEQRAGRMVTPSSDQFSLSASLFESLTGVLPPASAEGGRKTGFEPCRGVPRRVMRVVNRGLSQDPTSRYPSMDAFAQALLNASNTRLWPVGAVAAVGLVVAFAGPDDETPARCSGAQRQLERVWAPGRRDALEQSLRGPSLLWRTAMASAVRDRVDRYAQTWIETHGEICRSADRDPRMLDVGMICLERRLRELDAVLTVLEQGSTDVAVNATRAVDSLSPPDSCTGVDPLVRDGSNDPLTRRLEARLARARTLQLAGSFDAAESEARAVLVASVERENKWLESRARLQLGWNEAERGHYPTAEEQLRLAVALAMSVGNDDVVSRGFDRLAWVVGFGLGRQREGLELADQGELWQARVDGPDSNASGRATTRGQIMLDMGRPARALEYFEQAERSAGDEVRALGNAVAGRGSAYLQMSKFEPALAEYDRAVDIYMDGFGADHPNVLLVQSNRAGVLQSMGRGEEAVAVYDKVRTRFIATYGEDHVFVGQSAANVAVVLGALGRHEEAVVAAEEALRVFSTMSGESHPLVAHCYTLRGTEYLAMNRYDEGIRDLNRALAMNVELLGPDHPNVGIAQSNLSVIYKEIGQIEDAYAHQSEALGILLATHGDAHSLVVAARVNLGLIERARGNFEESLRLYELAAEHADPSARGVRMLELGRAALFADHVAEAVMALTDAEEVLSTESTTGARAEALLLLAQARWSQGLHREARALGTRALEVAVAQNDAAQRDEARSWLRSPGPFRPENTVEDKPR